MTNESPFVTSEEVAQYFNVEVQTVRRWIKRNTIPPNSYIKTGNEYRFDLERVKEGLFANNELGNDPKVDVFDLDEDI
tara:strand:+ start:1499 stop:1732 length:234 start_codon:yes stop_codon:yes gene_type:complete